MNWDHEYKSEWKEIIETVAREYGKSAKESIIGIAELLGMTLSNSEQIKSRFDYNMYIFFYNSLFCNAKQSLIIETNYYLSDIISLRTFIDKIFAICDYRIQNMQDRDSRHLYDICKLLNHVTLNEDMDTLIDTVRKDRMKSKNNPSAQLKYNIPSMLEEIIQSRFYESDYKHITQKLLYEDIDYNYAVKNGIAIVAASDVFNYHS